MQQRLKRRNGIEPRIRVSTKGYPNPLDETARAIKEAKRSVWAVVYKFDKFDKQPIQEAIRHALHHDADVRLLVDEWLVTKKKSKKKKYKRKSFVPEAAVAGAEVRRWKKGKLHVKFTIVDRSLVLSGSYNWTKGASKRNTELLLTFSEPATVNAFVRRFEKMWRLACPWKPK